MEPHNKKRWQKRSSLLFTCARPRIDESKNDPVDDKIVNQWVRDLPGQNTVIVSLLGKKPNGKSEYSFYSFCGRQTFQAWLNERYPDRSIQVIEHPTTDYEAIPSEVLAAAAADVSRLLAEGRTVVVVDSGGETRTGQLCEYMGFVKDTRQL